VFLIIPQLDLSISTPPWTKDSSQLKDINIVEPQGGGSSVLALHDLVDLHLRGRQLRSRW